MSMLVPFEYPPARRLGRRAMRDNTDYGDRRVDDVAVIDVI